LFASIAVLLWAGAAAAQARSLNGTRATVQFSAKMATTWSEGPYESSEEGCYSGSVHGSGKQVVELRQPGHANVTVVDFGGTIALQLPIEDRASPTKRGLGFPLGHLDREGVVEEDFAFAKNFPSLTCAPPPPPTHQDESGCGGHEINWDIVPLVSGGRLYPNVETFPPPEATVRCPFLGVVGKTDPNATTLPNKLTFHSIGVAEVRRDLGRRHGKLIVQGTNAWKSHTAGTEATASTSLAWKLTVIAAGH
jgi:hypothetical protein